jgi:hypothetical protein
MDVDQIPTETEKPSHAERAQIERDAGYIVAKIYGAGDFENATGHATEGLACHWARHFAAAAPGSRYGVFKLSREFTAHESQEFPIGKEAAHVEPPTEG